MPSSSLDWVQLDQQMVFDSAWQRRIGLPEGALSKPRLNNLTYLSEPFRTFVHHRFISACASEPKGWRIAHGRAAAKTRHFWRACGLLEDGVPHARALSPANICDTTSHQRPSRRAKPEFTLVVSSLATTHEASPK
jgi:hypothetical protein